MRAKNDCTFVCRRVLPLILVVTVFATYFNAHIKLCEEVKCERGSVECDESAVQPVKSSNTYCVTTSASSGTIQVHEELCYSPKKSDTNALNVRPFKGRHKGQSAVLLCTGPTLDEYTHEQFDKENRHVITVGVNSVIFTEVVQSYGLDYYFLQDTGRDSTGVGLSVSDNAFYKRVEEYTNFRPRIQTFYGLFRMRHIGPTDEETNAAAAVRYESEYPACSELVPLVADIGRYTFGGSCSVVMSALQFLLYTGVSSIKLVGCDVTIGAYAGGKAMSAPRSNVELLRMWKLVPDFIARYYPQVLIEVIRPVGLTGIDFNLSSRDGANLCE